MTPIKRQLRSLAHFAHYHATKSGRSKHLSSLEHQQKSPMMVSFYHRVADSFPNDWTISRAGFQKHLDYCRRNLHGVTLTEVQDRVSSGISPQATITVTFDDGYRENCEFAIPLLVEYQIPCVYFVAVNHVIHQTPFEHDARANRPLPVNTVSELRQMAEQGIEIGLHTFDHVDFSKITSEEVIRREILESKDKLEQLLGSSVDYFAFPYGLPAQLTESAVSMVHRAGLKGFCSAFGAYNLPGRDAFHIRRFHGDPDYSQFRKWLTFDPRKVLSEPTIKYELDHSTGDQRVPEPDHEDYCHA